jgi:hypothetical protein
MWILRLVRNFALLAVLALAAHAAVGANKGGKHCGGSCGLFLSCAKGCTCIISPLGRGGYCSPLIR